MLDSQILDIFYNQIIKEAQTGRVDCFFKMNIVFNLIIDNNIITSCENLKQEGILIPTLKVTNKQLFDSLLIEYVKKAIETYDANNFNFLEDLQYMNLEGDINSLKSQYLVKYVICSLFANLSYYDFENPIEFLKSRIYMLDNTILNGDTLIDLGYLESIDARLYIIEENSPIKSETPYRLRGYLEYEDGYQLLLPEVYVGKTQDKYQVYGIQKTTKHSDVPETNYIKQIRKGFVSKINGAPEHYFLMAMVLLSLCQDKPIEIIPFLVERWNAKKIALNNKKDMSEEEKIEYQYNLQNNITNVFIRYFTKLAAVSEGLEIDSVPFEFYININDNFVSKAPVFNELYNKSKEYKQKKKL